MCIVCTWRGSDQMCTVCVHGECQIRRVECVHGEGVRSDMYNVCTWGWGQIGCVQRVYMGLGSDRMCTFCVVCVHGAGVRSDVYKIQNVLFNVGLHINLITVYQHIEQLHDGPSQFWISLRNSP